MPVIHIHMLDGRTVEQKRALVDKVTKAVVETINTTPEHVKVLLHDMPREDYAVGGQLYIDKKS